MPRAQETIEPECKQEHGSSNFQGAMRQVHTRHEDSTDDDSNRKRVPQHDRRQRTEYGRALLLLQPERHGK